MKKIIKILIGISLILLLIGTVSAFEVDSLKPIKDYTNFKDGQSTFTTNSNRMFIVEKVTIDDSFMEDYFENNTVVDYLVIPVEDNIYYYEDGDSQQGYQEVVEIEGDTYLVSIFQNSKLSPGEKNLYLKDMKDFNKLNNLKPIEV